MVVGLDEVEGWVCSGMIGGSPSHSSAGPDVKLGALFPIVTCEVILVYVAADISLLNFFEIETKSVVISNGSIK